MYGWEIQRIPPKETTLVGFIQSRQTDLVIDVGANLGQFATHLRQKGYLGQIISFEPVPGTAERLRIFAANDTKWDVRPCALGNTTEHLEIFVFKGSDYSSILPPSSLARRYDEDGLTIEHKNNVMVKRLDDEIDPKEWKSIFLKIDTQGFEKKVLLGASEIVKRANGILIELPLMALYDDMWSFPEAIEYLYSSGFILSQVRPVNYAKNIDPSSMLEIDCVFRRADVSIDQTGGGET